MNVESPCVRVCQLDDEGMCVGCWRTIGEIARWTTLTAEERSAICASLAERQKIVNRFVLVAKH
jgi:uncharacterized protein